MKQRGGVKIRDGMSSGEAFNYFIENCESFKILTLDSLACITMECNFGSDDDRKECPYESITAYSFISGGADSLKRRKILLKILLTKEEQERERNLIIPGVRPDNFKRTPKSEIIRETEIQHELYTKSLAENNYALEPLCPGLLFVSPSAPAFYCRDYLLPIISPKILPRKGNKTQDIAILNAYFSANSGKHGIIAMDFADGFSTVEKTIETTPSMEYNACVYSLYELLRMYRMGWMHRDFHSGNVMYCSDYTYMSYDPELSGKSLLIDFGMAKQLGAPETDNLPIPKTFKESVNLLKKEYFGSMGKVFEKILGLTVRGKIDDESFNEVEEMLNALHEERLTMASEFIDIVKEVREGETPEYIFKTSNMFSLRDIAKGGAKMDLSSFPKMRISPEKRAEIQKNVSDVMSRCGENKLKELFVSAFQSPPVVDFVPNRSSELGFETIVDEKETQKLMKSTDRVFLKKRGKPKKYPSRKRKIYSTSRRRSSAKSKRSRRSV